MHSIIKHQREFFERGIAHLRPLNLRDVAAAIEMPASTGNVLLTRDRHDELHVRQVLGPLEEPPEGWSGQRYVCHFETCPDAGAWRKHKREKTKQTQGRLL